MTESSFSILDDPWILVRTLDGRTELLSVLDTLRRADDLAHIVGDLPTQSLAILRVLVALLAQSTEGPADAEAWLDLAENGPPRDRIEEYCDRCRDRFFLFHPTTPFMQVAGLHAATGRYSGLNKLVADVPAGHQFFTTRSGSGMVRLTPAEATRWLVHAQAWDISGIKTGAVGDERVKGGKGYPIGNGWAGTLGGVYVEGPTLWRTLLYNLIPRSETALVYADARDRPAWEATPDGPGPATDLASRPYGPLDLFTWQSRRILLIGDHRGVTDVLLANGDRLAPPYLWKREPMTAWRRSAPQEKKLKQHLVYMPRAHQPERAFWRGLGAILPTRAPRAQAKDGAPFLAPAVFEWAQDIARTLDDDVLRLRAVGMSYGTQNASVTDVYEDSLDVHPAVLGGPGSILAEYVARALDATELGVMKLRNLAADLLRAAGTSETAAIDGARARVAERAYADLDTAFRTWISGLGAADDTEARGEAAQIVWHRVAHRIIARIGSDVVANAGVAAWVGREVKGRRLTSPHADAIFRAGLRTALPFPREPRQETSTDSGPITDGVDRMTAATATRAGWTHQDAQAVNRFVSATATRLQNGYVRAQPTPASRAGLARLRRGVGKSPASCPELAEFYVDPTEWVDDAHSDPTPREWAAHIALGLFAVHQQSAPTRMHRPRMPFGAAVGKVANGGEDAGITRRFQALATTTNPGELAIHARGLVQLLRREDQGFDYGEFAGDLVLFRNPSAVDDVRLRWGRAFYRLRATDDDPDGEHHAHDTSATDD